jgi:hypothetical protein
MADIHPKLQEVIDQYFDRKSKVLNVENESAVSPLHQAFVNNIRHGLDHLMEGF